MRFRLRFEHSASAALLAQLVIEEPLGPLTGCDIKLNWTRDSQAREFWEGSITLSGEFSPQLRGAELSEGAAMALLREPPASPPTAAAGRDLARNIEVAERINWEVLRPFLADGKGEVIHVLPGTAPTGIGDAGPAGLDLLVRTGAAPSFRYLRVPASALPLLARVRRESPLLSNRFVLFTRCEPMPMAAASEDARSPRASVEVHVQAVSICRESRIPWLAKVVLTPLAACGDGLIWFLEHGPTHELISRLRKEREPERWTPRRSGRADSN